jgi:hypothetical protein
MSTQEREAPSAASALQEYIEYIVSQAPPLTAEQRLRLAELLTVGKSGA